LGGAPHVEASRSEAAIAYCHKDDTRVHGPYEFGERSKSIRRGQRTDLATAIEDIRAGRSIADVADRNAVTWVRNSRGLTSLKYSLIRPRDRAIAPTIKIYIGPTGSGKTKRATDYAGDAEVYTKDPNTKWWDGYEGQKLILIDEWIGSEGIPPTQLLRICDRYELRVETKGGYIQMAGTTILVTSTREVREWYQDGRSREWSEKQDDFMRRVNEWGEIIRTGEMP